MKSNIKLIIYTTDHSLGVIKVLTTEVSDLIFPVLELNKFKPDNTSNLDNAIKSLYQKYSEITFDWTKPKLVSIDYYQEENENVLDIYYCIYIPKESRLLSGMWLELSPQLYHPIFKKFLCLI